MKNTDLLPKAKHIVELKSDVEGYVKGKNTEKVGLYELVLGAARETKESQIDLSAGIVMNKKVDDRVEEGEAVAYIHTKKEDKIKEVKNRLKNAFKIENEKNEEKQLIFGIVSKEGIKRLS